MEFFAAQVFVGIVLLLHARAAQAPALRATAGGTAPMRALLGTRVVEFVAGLPFLLVSVVLPVQAVAGRDDP